jgi:glycosyltransferase involved in cell wall biosynthesis
MKVLIGIATYQRINKLERLIQSLKKQTYQNFDVYVVCDNRDTESADYIISKYPSIMCTVMGVQSYVIGCWNFIHKVGGYDAHLTLCDDVELLPDCLEKAVNELRTNFPDGDGVIGITQLYPGQDNVKFQPTGQVLMGKKFINRFKYDVCCPNYKQWYQDNELLEFSSKLGKFKLSGEAKLIHHHPCYYPSEMDHTHTLVRNNSVQVEDKKKYQMRLARKLVWGESWELI